MNTPDPVSPAVSAAADMAASYMRDGMEPRTALMIAANSYGVHIREVAAAAGKRGGRKRKPQSRKAEERAAFDFIKPA